MTDQIGATPIDTRQSERKVILASSLGTVFEWYDFYLYGLLATVISAQFFSGVNETTGFIFGARRLCRGLRGAALRGDLLRAHRRPCRTQEHLPRHHGPDGRVDLPRRRAAQLRVDRRRRANPACRAAVVARPSRSAANMAVQQPMSPNMRRKENAGCSPASFRPPRRSGCSRRLASSSPSAP